MTTAPSTEVIFTVAKNGYGTEPSLRFSTYEDAEKKFIEYSRDGYTNVVLIEVGVCHQCALKPLIT